MNTGSGARKSAIAAAAICAALSLGACASASADIDERAQRDDAKSACHEWVKNKLKSPSTAKFSGESYDGDAGVYTFRGSVDSQNGFGAMVRSSWTCKVRSSGDEWRGSAQVADG